MSIVQVHPSLEDWLEAGAASWSALSDREYKTLVRRWSTTFLPLVAANAAWLQGDRAIMALESRLPSDVFVFSGFKVPQLANTGGRGAAGYLARGLRNLRRELANQMEVIVASDDLAWSCVFSHEAGAWVWECLYECDSEARARPRSFDHRGTDGTSGWHDD